MTALTQEVLTDMSLPSGSPFVEPPQPIVEAKELDLSYLARSGEEKLAGPEDMDMFVRQSLNIHPRATEVAEKLTAWLKANKADYGVRIRTSKPPQKPTYELGHNWMSVDPETVLALDLDYHENPFWLNNPTENKLRRFLRSMKLELIKLDCTRWYVLTRAYTQAESVTEADDKPVFKPYKSPITGNEGMALYIPYPERITTEQWAKISNILRQKGYDIRGGADAQRFVYGYMQKHNNQVPPVFKDWIDTIALVLGVKAPSQSPDAKTSGATPGSKALRRAVRKWGTTHDPALAGYILPSGAMLDMSGGSGTRAYDHREVEQFFDEHFEERVDAMHAFMDMGAIRWMPEGVSVDIRTPPTGKQLSTLHRALESVLKDGVFVDVYLPKYGSASATYPATVSPRKVIADIQHFYRTGEMRQPSDLQKFHEAAESAVNSLISRDAMPRRFLETAKLHAIVNRLLEGEQLELPLDNTPEDEPTNPDEVMSHEEIGDWLDRIGITKGYQQIDGDFGDPWLYGGTWYSAGIEADEKKWASVIHIDGAESEGLKDYYSGDKKVQAEAAKPAWRARIAQIKAEKYPDDEDDERATDEVCEEIAEQFNANVKQTVYRTNADDPNNESWVTDSLSGLLSSMGLTHEQWMEMGPEGRVAAVGSYYGWHELDSYAEKYTKAELSNYLGIEL